MKHLFNSTESCVDDLVQGLLLSNSALVQLEGYNALVRRDIETVKRSEVTLISGGGSGHEPAHAGFIGEGMLSAAVLGNVFASPSVASILATIRAVAGPSGVLLIVKNYTGDRLNFGMALEIAKKEGIRGKMLIVDDDCALEKCKGITGGRGIAGTVLVHKIVGAAAKLGKSLEEVFSLGEKAVKSLRTLGVALSTCTVPGTLPSERLSAPRAIEIGMGIHGEPGREQAVLPDTDCAKYIAQVLVDGVVSPQTVERESDAVVLINNLGTLPVLELHIVAKEILENLVKKSVVPARVFIGSYMTSLDMNGLSLSVLSLANAAADCELLALVDLPCSASAWTPSRSFSRDDFDLSRGRAISVAHDTHGVAVSNLFADHASSVALCQAVAMRIVEVEPLLTQYDAICGDGDCGLVMKKGAMKVLEVTNAYAGADVDVAEFCDRIANALSHSMGGTSGVLLELAFRSMVNHFQAQNVKERRVVSASEWIAALDCGVQAVQQYGGASVGMRTMLDALVPAVETLKAGKGLVEAVEAAHAGVETTKTMEGLAGRSNYVAAERMLNTPDPGAFAMYTALDAIVQSLT